METTVQYPLFQEPQRPGDGAGRRLCGLPGCTEVVPFRPGNERTVTYCCYQHRRESRARRSRSRSDRA